MNTQEAFEYFDSCDAVDINFMLGRWQGSGFPTDHPMDGLLEAYGWYGKEFISADAVHPLLFKRGDQSPYQLTSQGIPLGPLLKYPLTPTPLLINLTKPLKILLHRKSSTARLQAINYRGQVSSSMVYDYQPIIDHFRKVDANNLIGVMDSKMLEQPFFFQLHRDLSSSKL